LRAATPAALYAGERAYHLKIPHVLTGDREGQVARELVGERAGGG
jgi:hypothetical protein